MNYKQLQEDVEKYVSHYFHSHHDPRLVYHNLEHTREVVGAAQQIADHYQLSEEDFFAVTVAAYFHDTGYFEDALNHEVKGAELADEFLVKHKIPENIRETVKSAILATKIPQRPKNQIDKILCDADLFHLGLADFRRKGKLMHKEVELIHKKDIGKNEWRKKDIQFMETHRYHTDYAILLLNDQKQANINKLKSKLPTHC